MRDRLKALAQSIVDKVRDRNPQRSVVYEISHATAVAHVEDKLLTMFEDAERWRALIGCARMHYMGSANFAHDLIDPAGPKNKLANLRPVPVEGAPYLHFGMEFWSNYQHESFTSQQDDRFERDMVTAFVDHIVQQKEKNQQGEGK